MTNGRAGTFPYWPGSIFGLVPQRCAQYKGTRDNPETESPTVLELRPVLKEWQKAKRAIEDGYETPLHTSGHGMAGEPRHLGFVRLAAFWPDDSENFKVVLQFTWGPEKYRLVQDILATTPTILSLEVVNGEVASVALVPLDVTWTELPRP